MFQCLPRRFVLLSLKQFTLCFLTVNFARTVPNGLLVFFPSYPVMNKCLEHWQVSVLYFFIRPTETADLLINSHQSYFATVKRKGKVSIHA